MRSVTLGVGLAALLSLGGFCSAEAGERHGYTGYPDSYGYGPGGYGYGFGGEAISGGYIGAPFTRFPRPSELVPSPWGYGTYGVPTVAGIRQAPTAPPTLTVIDGDGPVPRRRSSGRRLLSRDGNGPWASNAPDAAAGPNGVRVISVTVPRH